MITSLEKRVLVFAFIILTLTFAIDAGLDIESFRTQYREALVYRCQNLADRIVGTINHSLSASVELERIEGLNGRCQEMVATEEDIVYCLVENAAGEIIFSSDPAIDKFQQGHRITEFENADLNEYPRIGKALDVAVPFFHSDRSIAGVVRIGLPYAVLQSLTIKTFLRHSMLLGFSFVLIFTVIIYFTRRNLGLPVASLHRVSRQVAKGNFQMDMPNLGQGEFRELGSSLKGMAHSLRERDDQLQQNYRELEETNLLLQKAYEEQERISTELAKSQELYRELFSGASDAIVVSDDDNAVILYNDRAEEFFGLPAEEVLGKDLFLFLQRLETENLEKQFEDYQRVLDGERPEVEIRFKNQADGQPRIGSVRSSLFQDKGGGRLVQAIVHDTTRETEIKENMQSSSRELLRLNQMKDSFLGLVSHELKTPLTIVLGYTELLRNDMRDAVPPRLQPVVKNIGDAAERLSRVVQDMVDVSLIDGRSLQLDIQEIQLNTLVQLAVNNLEFSLDQRDQKAELRLDAGLPPIKGDSRRLLQMVNNLLKNAIKFSPDGGTIHVKTRLVNSLDALPKVGTVPEGVLRNLSDGTRAYAGLVVTDSGVGIIEDDRELVFEKFFGSGRIEEHSSGHYQFKSKGPGLGLAIVKGIVELHGGEVWVESCRKEEDCAYPGISFYVLLPLPHQPA